MVTMLKLIEDRITRNEITVAFYGLGFGLLVRLENWLDTTINWFAGNYGIFEYLYLILHVEVNLIHFSLGRSFILRKKNIILTYLITGNYALYLIFDPS